MAKQTGRYQRAVSVNRWHDWIFIAALGTTTIVFLILVLCDVNLENEAVSASAGLLVALLAVFIFVAQDDPDFGYLPDAAKALAAGAALPVAVLTSGAKLTEAAMIIVAAVYALLSVAVIQIKRGRWRVGRDGL